MLCVVCFVVLASFTFDPAGLLGDVEREDDRDLGFEGGSRDE